MGDGGSTPSPFIAGEGQPAPPTITGNDGFSLHAAVTRQVGQLPRQHGEAKTPTSNQPPRVNQGRRLLGPAVLRTCPLASPRSQVRARLGPGGYCRLPGNGGPQTCLPAAHGVALPAGPYGPSSPTSIQDPRKGPCLARRMTQDLLGGGEIKARGTSRGSCDASHDDQGQAGTRRAPARVVSLFPLSKEASAGAEYQGVKQRFPYRCNETKTSRTTRQRSPWSPRRRHHQSLLQAKTAFVRISCTSCPLSNWPLLAPFPLNIWKRTRASIKG